MKTAQLVPFPTSANKQVGANRTIFVTIAQSNHDIVVQFILQGDTQSIQWPATAKRAGPGIDLWKHTCFELFLSAANHREYWEYNFSPSGQWAIYAFQDYRQPAPLVATHKPVIEPPHHSDREFIQQIRFTPEPPLINKLLNIGVTTIIETTDGQIRYYALRHCDNKPDFHLRESFVLQL